MITGGMKLAKKVLRFFVAGYLRNLRFWEYMDDTFSGKGSFLISRSAVENIHIHECPRMISSRHQ